MAEDLVNMWALTLGPVIVYLTPWIALGVLVIVFRRLITPPTRGSA